MECNRQIIKSHPLIIRKRRKFIFAFDGGKNMNLYWVGARQSDVKHNKLFAGSISRYGDDNDNNFSFCNNTFTHSYDDFVQEKASEILTKDEDAWFMFANERSAYQYGKSIFEKSICLNPLHIIESMNDKIFTRNIFSDCVNTPNSVLINSSSCLNYSFIKDIFNNKYSEFVLQEANGAGGLKNYFLSKDNFPKIVTNSAYMLVTPYFHDAITVNVHIIVDKRTYKILPPSLQITVKKFKYSGSDFVAFSNMPSQIKSNVLSCAKEIAKKVMSLEAKGIFGIDLLILDNKILFLECNYRYQGSSFVLNNALIEAGYPSIFELRYNSFYKDISDIPDNIYDLPVAYSSFRRTKENKNIQLPPPSEIIATNKSSFASSDQYQQYELYTSSIIERIEKQEAQNLC